MELPYSVVTYLVMLLGIAIGMIILMGILLVVGYFSQKNDLVYWLDRKKRHKGDMSQSREEGGAKMKKRKKAIELDPDIARAHPFGSTGRGSRPDAARALTRAIKQGERAREERARAKQKLTDDFFLKARNPRCGGGGLIISRSECEKCGDIVEPTKGGVVLYRCVKCGHTQTSTRPPPIIYG